MPDRPALPRRHLPGAVAFALAAAAWLGAGTGAATAAPDPAVVDVLLRELPAEDVWQISYMLPERVAGVEMARARTARRHLGWGLAPAGSTWQRSGTTERICFPEPVRTFAVSFRSDFDKPEKDYEPNIAMSDGTRLLYTGNLLVRLLERCGPGDGAEASVPLALPVVHHFRLQTDPGRTVRVGDAAAEERLDWKPPPGEEETYAVFGNVPVAQSDRALFVLDPNLPAWLGDDLRSLLPKLFEHFAGETGMSLPVRPTVVVAHQAGGGGRSFSGGVLHQLVVMAVAGEGWAEPDDPARRDWFLRLAHEVFHLWGGDALHADEESEWLSEAAAEAFALRAAVALGVVPAHEYLGQVVTAANRCLVELDGAALLAAPERGSYASWYSCGPTLLFVADRAVDRAKPGQGGLGLLFREMFAEGRLAGDVYGTGVFLGWLDKLSGDRPTVFALQRLIRHGVERGAESFLAELLRGAGVEVELVSLEEAGADQATFQALLRRALVRCACGTAQPETSGDPDCARFGAASRLHRVGGVDAGQDPAEAYGRLRGAVLLARPLRVVAGDDEQAVDLLCPRDTLESSFQRLLRLTPPIEVAPAG
jgi:hypothetical protein